jgi:superfamily II DNA helicase RecQ
VLNKSASEPRTIRALSLQAQAFPLLSRHEWQSAVLAHDGIVLVVCSLVFIMQDQVAASARLGLKAAAVYADTLLKNLKPVKDICKGIYNAVFVAPELCVPGNKDWMRMTADSIFLSKLMAVVIDEAHLVHSRRNFG